MTALQILPHEIGSFASPAAMLSRYRSVRQGFWQNRPAPPAALPEPPRPSRLPVDRGFAHVFDYFELPDRTRQTMSSYGRPKVRSISVKNTTCADVLDAASRVFGFPIEVIIGSRRDAPLVFARQVACFICFTNCGFCYSHIGRRFGGRDHTTILYAVRKIARLAAEPKYAAKIAAVLADLEASA